MMLIFFVSSICELLDFQNCCGYCFAIPGGVGKQMSSGSVMKKNITQKQKIYTSSSPDAVVKPQSRPSDRLNPKTIDPVSSSITLHICKVIGLIFILFLQFLYEANLIILSAERKEGSADKHKPCCIRMLVKGNKNQL